jgi:hypothetical protein
MNYLDFGTSLSDISFSWRGKGMVQEASGDHEQNGKSHFAGLELSFLELRRENEDRNGGMQVKREESSIGTDIRRVCMSLYLTTKRQIRQSGRRKEKAMHH